MPSSAALAAMIGEGPCSLPSKRSTSARPSGGRLILTKLSGDQKGWPNLRAIFTRSIIKSLR
jgi:hypothetical protein